jgi:hypothetical protein
MSPLVVVNVNESNCLDRVLFIYFFSFWLCAFLMSRLVFIMFHRIDVIGIILILIYLSNKHTPL